LSGIDPALIGLILAFGLPVFLIWLLVRLNRRAARIERELRSADYLFHDTFQQYEDHSAGDASGGERVELSDTQIELLQLLEETSEHILKRHEHMPVSAFAMDRSGKIGLIDLEGGFHTQDDALEANLAELVAARNAGRIMAAALIFQLGDAGENKNPILLFDIDVEFQYRTLVTVNYERKNGGIIFGEKKYTVVDSKLFPAGQAGSYGASTVH
jgi:hypothetical protein